MRYVLALCVALGALANVASAEPAVLLKEAKVLPLALRDEFEFRKVLVYSLPSYRDQRFSLHSIDPMVQFEQKRRTFGAITRADRREREGHYYTFYWRANRPAGEVRVRLEYRQEKLGSYVQAREVVYNDVDTANYKTEFSVVGDDYHWDGRVTAWRAVVIEDNRIVALHPSYLWN